MVWRSIIINPNKKKFKSNNDLVNEKIRFAQVMLINKDGSKSEILTASEALEIAYDQDLDLVCVAPNAKVPVCKVMDYKKHKYEQQKKARLSKKNQVRQELKELRLSPTIDIGDYNTKLKRGLKFLEVGHKLKLSIRFRGRMIQHKDLGYKVMLQFAKDCEQLAEITTRPKMEGRSLHLLLSPIKKK